MSTGEQLSEAEGMLDVAELRKIFAEKLAATDSLDAAFLKAVWVAFKRGIAVTNPEKNAELRRQLELVTGALEGLLQCSISSNHGDVDSSAPISRAEAALAAVRKPADTVFGVPVDELAAAIKPAGEAAEAELEAVIDEAAELEAVMDAVADALGDAYDCRRVWEAWFVGTMSQNDFARVADSGERLAEIASAAIGAMRKNIGSPAGEGGDRG